MKHCPESFVRFMVKSSLIAIASTAALLGAVTLASKAHAAEPDHVFYAGGPVCSSPFAADDADSMFVLHQDFNHFPASCVVVAKDTKVIVLKKAGSWRQIGYEGKLMWTTQRFLQMFQDGHVVNFASVFRSPPVPDSTMLYDFRMRLDDPDAQWIKCMYDHIVTGHAMGKTVEEVTQVAYPTCDQFEKPVNDSGYDLLNQQVDRLYGLE